MNCACGKRLESGRKTCRTCRRKKDALNYDVTAANDGRVPKDAAKNKRQEFSKSMAEVLESYRTGERSEAVEKYVLDLANGEDGFGNTRLARSISLSDAHETLHLKRFMAAASHYLTGKVTPVGYAKKKPNQPVKRSVVIHLSDLHIGATLGGTDNPTPFGAVEEARRLEWILRQVLTYKPQYRKDSECVVLLNGDIIDGLLLHDLRDGAPLTEQICAAILYLEYFIAEISAVFPKVRVFCQPGNHGRNKLRHPGRATSSKWDSFETQIYFSVSRTCSKLKNVEFNITKRAVSVIPLHDQTLLMTHGDTEIKLKHPRHHDENFDVVSRYVRDMLGGIKIDAFACGHFHSPVVAPGSTTFVYNGMLVPSNGYARTMGYTSQACGQYMWESVPGHAVGDLRYIKVGVAQDNDETLGELIKPFRYEG